MLGYVFTSSLKDFLRPGRVAVWVILALGIGLMGRLWISLGAPGNPQETYGQLASVIVYRFMALVAAIFSTMVVSQEVDQKTIVYLLTRTVPRSTMLLGRTLACIVAVTLISWIGSLCGGLGVMGLSTLGAKGWWFDLVILALGAATYSIFFVGISLLLQRAMVFSLLFAFGWETFVPNMPGDLYYVSIYTYLNSLSAHPKLPMGQIPVLDALSGRLTGNLVSSGLAFTILVAFAIVMVGASMWWFNKFEYVPREDGE